MIFTERPFSGAAGDIQKSGVTRDIAPHHVGVQIALKMTGGNRSNMHKKHRQPREATQ
jgi:hypothetical protein